MTTRGRRFRGVLVGAVTFAVIAVPAAYSTMFAVASFTGCFIECSTPDPAVGALWSAITVVLLGLPVVAGVAAARNRQRPAWIAGAILVLAVVYTLSQRVV